MRLRNKQKFTLLMLGIVFALAFQIIPHNLFVAKIARASSFETISITNGNFNSNPTSTFLDTVPTGWKKAKGSTPGTYGVINTGENKFNKSNYKLAENPQTMTVDSSDTKVLMLNARVATEDAKIATDKSLASEGYKSDSTIALQANSYYKLTILAKTEFGAFGSIYLSGFSEEGANEQAKFEKIQTYYDWKQYDFYIETGTSAENITIALWLGTQNGVSSPYAVFYDNATLIKLSQTKFNEDKTLNGNSKIVEIAKTYLTSVGNSDFEIANINAEEIVGNLYWTPISAFPANSVRKIINTSTTNSAIMTAEGYKFLGGDNLEGSHALWLGAKEAVGTTIGYTSTSLQIDKFGYYKISVNAKVDENTKAKISILENDDVIEFLKSTGVREELITYTAKTSSLEITSNPETPLTNNYGTYVFYIKADSLYNTSLKLQLSLETTDTESGLISGSVLFDNIIVEAISSSDYTGAATSSSAAKLDLSTITGTPTVVNGTFNSATVLKTDNKFPLAPTDWEATIKDKAENVFGVVNTQADHFEANRARYGTINPGSPSGISTELESNNLLMLWNKTVSYQSLTSNAISISSNNYYTLSFNFKTTHNNANFNVKVLNQDGALLHKSASLTSSNAWLRYEVVVKVGNSSTTSLKLVLGLGTEEVQSQGHVFVDNVGLTQNSTLTTEDFDTLVLTNATKTLSDTLDLSQWMLNNPLVNSSGEYEISAFSGKYEDNKDANNTSAFAGVVNGELNTMGVSNSAENTQTNKYIYFIQANSTAKYSLTSHDSFQLDANTQYKFSVFVKTNLTTPSQDYKKNYGASFSLLGLEQKIEHIQTNGEWQEVIIVVKTTTSTSVNLIFALDVQTETSGIMFLDNFTFTTITSSEYEAYMTEYETDENSNLLVIGSTDEPEVEEEEPEKENNFSWVIIPSLLTAAALILAIIGTVLRRVNFKKFAKRKQNEYDRNQTLYKDVIRKEAEVQRDAELEGLNKELLSLNQTLDELEQTNKEKLSEQRKSKSKTIDKASEKEFKAYASKRTKLEKQKDLLVSKIAHVNTAEYLLSLQKKIKDQKIKDSLKK